MGRQTLSVPLPGGQDRLRQMILYVSKRNEGARYFGRTKLNKILWRADFDAFRARRKPVTGRAYQRLERGPAPKEMRPLLNEMLVLGEITEETVVYSDQAAEKRPIARAEPDLSQFSVDDIRFVDAAIEYYWDRTGRETSDDSHGIAWKTRGDRAPMPYENAFLSDYTLSEAQIARMKNRIERLGLETK